ncbi:MAG TPA: hypothetical protein VE954_11420 [Oligoflexus sp.]|uniref:hypothetical protein n=1 Tax=Oligoflexus sp. TaxID=1971216 RepID=UPI002D24557C|nr:hypothetical protein [Oligoflexus sp.]HYX33714.1 hypothetical protein [Oligoflexus sp.]
MGKTSFGYRPAAWQSTTPPFTLDIEPNRITGCGAQLLHQNGRHFNSGGKFKPFY